MGKINANHSGGCSYSCRRLTMFVDMVVILKGLFIYTDKKNNTPALYALLHTGLFVF